MKDIEIDSPWWTHFCTSANDTLKIRKNSQCEFCDERYISTEEENLRSKIPVEYFTKIIG